MFNNYFLDLAMLTSGPHIAPELLPIDLNLGLESNSVKRLMFVNKLTTLRNQIKCDLICPGSVTAYH